MRSTAAIFVLGIFASLPAYAQNAINPKRPQEALVSNPNYDKPVGLAINGFNYTDRVISAFSIDSQGGGNIFVSSPTSGGGKTTCCMTWYPGSQLYRPVKIEWMRYLDGRRTWCKKEVMLKAPFPKILRMLPCISCPMSIFRQNLPKDTLNPSFALKITMTAIARKMETLSMTSRQLSAKALLIEASANRQA